MSLESDVLGALRSVEELADGQGCRGSFRFDPALEVFGGHFPGRPLLPGVFQLEMLRRVWLRWRGGEARISRVIKARFRRPALPSEEIIVELKLGKKPGTLRGKATRGGVCIASVALVLDTRPTSSREGEASEIL